MNMVTVSRKIRFLTRGIINSVLLNTVCRKKFDITRTLIVMGSTRSGTTWLSEIVNTVPGSAILFEPISPTHVSRAAKAGFTFDTYAEPDFNWPEGYDYMEKVLSGKVMTPWTTSQIPVRETCSTETLIVKFVRANMLFGWLVRNFPVRPPALIIRHPCATVASQIRKGWIPSPEMLLNNRFFRDKPDTEEFCRSLKYPEEILALRWCMRYYVPLALPDRPCIIISYERLVRKGHEELNRLFNSWNMEMPQEAVLRLRRPSVTVSKNSQIISGRDPLLGWKNSLSREQVSRILKVVSFFGLDFFSEDVEPDYTRLFREIPKPLI